jgi:hypothetical protein
MPKPLFIIVCQSGAEDKDTGLISLFHVVDRIDAQILKIPPEGLKGTVLVQDMPLKVVATWIKDDDESYDQEYEFQVVGLMPPDGTVGFSSNGSFRFSEGKPRHRLTANVHGQLPVKGSGTLLVESKVRKVGTQDWIVQSYPIQVEATEVAVPAAPDGTKPAA